MMFKLACGAAILGAWLGVGSAIRHNYRESKVIDSKRYEIWISGVRYGTDEYRLDHQGGSACIYFDNQVICERDIHIKEQHE